MLHFYLQFIPLILHNFVAKEYIKGWVPMVTGQGKVYESVFGFYNVFQFACDFRQVSTKCIDWT